MLERVNEIISLDLLAAQSDVYSTLPFKVDGKEVLIVKEYEKKQIESLWKEGYGSTRIAKRLDLNVNTVKSYCRRKGFSGDRGKIIDQTDEGSMGEPRCRNCGSLIIQKENSKNRLYCSDKCRMEWWNKHRELVNRKSEVKLICKNCGKTFLDYGSRERKYCSHKCYIDHRYSRDSGNTGQ